MVHGACPGAGTGTGWQAGSPWTAQARAMAIWHQLPVVRRWVVWAG